MGRLLSIAITVSSTPKVTEIGFRLPGWNGEGTKKRVKGDSRGWGKDKGQRKLLSSLVKHTKWGKEAVKKLGKCIIMVHGFLTYQGPLISPPPPKF